MRTKKSRKLSHNEPEDHKTRMALRKAQRGLRTVTHGVSTGKYTPLQEQLKHGPEHR